MSLFCLFSQLDLGFVKRNWADQEREQNNDTRWTPGAWLWACVCQVWSFICHQCLGPAASFSLGDFFKSDYFWFCFRQLYDSLSTRVFFSPGYKLLPTSLLLLWQSPQRSVKAVWVSSACWLSSSCFHSWGKPQRVGTAGQERLCNTAPTKVHKHSAAGGDREHIASLKGLFSGMVTGKISPLKSLIV